MLSWVMNLKFRAGPAAAVITGVTAPTSRLHRVTTPLHGFTRFTFLLGALRAFFTN